MAQQPEIVPQGDLSEKYHPHSYATHRRRLQLEWILVALIFLFVALVFGVLVVGSLFSIDTANQHIQLAPTTPK
ncbi:MAG TPA: hypothetical protein VH186_24190 [Chloroflexia bacterium]|nr:hypothetical protein [Chloroflexia bacterium]